MIQHECIKNSVNIFDFNISICSDTPDKSMATVKLVSSGRLENDVFKNEM